MEKKLRFAKMQGTGNDYVYVNCFEEQVDSPETLARKISDRHFGVGSDGLVLVLPSDVADVRMRMFNADGSEAQMCGNAARCVGKFARERGLAARDTVRVETAAGTKTVRLRRENGRVTGGTVDMGEPEFRPEALPVVAPAGCLRDGRVIGLPLEIEGRVYAATALSMGNPHAVIFVEETEGIDLPRLGPLFEHHSCFPQRVNTEFARVISADKIRMRVWERGAGETLACGTGACATVVAAALNGLAGREADVELRGGVLHINWDNDGHVYMTGDAVDVFEGVYRMT
jgi:diaminopimelate epimerase